MRRFYIEWESKQLTQSFRDTAELDQFHSPSKVTQVQFATSYDDAVAKARIAIDDAIGVVHIVQDEVDHRGRRKEWEDGSPIFQKHLVLDKNGPVRACDEAYD
jgi:hypothetical protein